MGIYRDMLEKGVIHSKKIYKTRDRYKDGKPVKGLKVDIMYRNNIITISSDLYCDGSDHAVLAALESAKLESVSVLKASYVEPGDLDITLKKINPSDYDTHYANANVLYTSEGIYLCKESWLNDSTLACKVNAITKTSLRHDLTLEQRDILNSLGAKKIVDYKHLNNQTKEKSIYRVLLDKGARIVKELEYAKERQKVVGYMFSASSCLELDGITYSFEMWYNHNGDHMTKSQVMEKIKLNSITLSEPVAAKLLHNTDCKQRHFESTFNILVFRTCLYLHTRNWALSSTDSESTKLCKSKRAIQNKIGIEGLTPKLEKDLLKLGFIKIL